MGSHSDLCPVRVLLVPETRIRLLPIASLLRSVWLSNTSFHPMKSGSAFASLRMKVDLIAISFSSFKIFPLKLR